MRKASHIKLNSFLIERVPELRKHKISILIGCILPDCIPSFVYKKHTIENTLHIVEKEMQKIQKCREINSYFCRHIGIITHYLADYCTLPHNKVYSGGIKQHTIYEGRLRQELKSYLDKLEEHIMSIHEDIENILDFIVKHHRRYIESIKFNNDNIENDCYYIASINLAIIKHLVKITLTEVIEGCGDVTRGLASL